MSEICHNFGFWKSKILLEFHTYFYGEKVSLLSKFFGKSQFSYWFRICYIFLPCKVHWGSLTVGGHYYAYFKYGEHWFGFNVKEPKSWDEPGMRDIIKSLKNGSVCAYGLMYHRRIWISNATTDLNAILYIGWFIACWDLQLYCLYYDNSHQIYDRNMLKCHEKTYHFDRFRSLSPYKYVSNSSKNL